MDRSIDNIARQSLLYDFYGQLLTERQGQIIELYTQENYSLGEISSELEISRQAVHDALRKAQRSLERYEEKLGLVKRFLDTREAIEEIDRRILDIIEKTPKYDRAEKTADERAEKKAGGDWDRVVRELAEVRAIIDSLEE